MTEINDIKCNDGLLRIEIIATETKGSGMGKFTVYHIKGNDSLGDIDVYRRYSEFRVF